MKNANSAFTLTEIMVVIIIMSVIASFAIPQYRKTITRAYEREGLQNLTMIHASEKTYRAEHGEVWPTDAGAKGVNDINTNLNLNIIEDGMTYSCSSSSTTDFTCTAAREGGGFTLRVNQNDLGSSNPCCSDGDCPTANDC